MILFTWNVQNKSKSYRQKADWLVAVRGRWEEEDKVIAKRYGVSLEVMKWLELALVIYTTLWTLNNEFYYMKFYLKYIYIFIYSVPYISMADLGTDSEALLTAQWFLEVYALH